MGHHRPLRGNLAELSPDYVYGKRVEQDEWGVRKCIIGDYNLEEQQPDKDLGKSTRKLNTLTQLPANHDEGRAYGVATIRHDKAAPATRSVAGQSC